MKELLETALDEARAGLAEGGIPIGAALFAADGTLLGRGHNRRVQDDDPSMHAETSAFRNAGRQRDYRKTIMVTTLSPCWYCSGLVRQFGIGAVVVGEARTFYGAAQPAWRQALLDRAAVTRVVLPADAGPTPVGWLGEGTPFTLVGRVGEGPAAIAVYARAAGESRP